MESDVDDEKIAEFVEDIVTHTIQVRAGINEEPSYTAKTNAN